MLSAYLHVQLDDPAIFPQMYGAQFPANFVDVIRVIFKRLFRVYAHIYHSHFKSVCGLGEEAHLNTCFRHFMYFTQVRCGIGVPL
jgi:MOB kinase activator 1